MKREQLYVLGDGDSSTYYKSEADAVMDAMEARIKKLEHQVMTDCTCDSSKSATLRMDLYKAQERIKELEAEVKKWKNDAANCCALLHLVRKGKNPTSTEMIEEADRLEKLEAENERLKRSHTFEKKQAELWRDKAVKLEHEKHPEHFDHDDHISNESEKVAHHNELCVAKSESSYNPLKMFYEIAEKYFATSTPQELENAIKEQRENYDIIYKGFVKQLREENEKLKAQVPKWHDLTKPLYTEDGVDYYDLPTEHGDYIVDCGGSACTYSEYDPDYNDWCNVTAEVLRWCEFPTTEESSATEKENG